MKVRTALVDQNENAKNIKRKYTASFILSWKVDGNMLGNNFKNTGSRNSMNGTMITTTKGTSLKTYAVVLVSYCLSLLDKLFPPASFNSS